MVDMTVSMNRAWADKEVDKGKGMVKRYKSMMEKYEGRASEAAISGGFAKAESFNRMAREARDCMHYWLGHMNAFQGLACQLGFMEIVEDELEGEGSCP